MSQSEPEDDDDAREDTFYSEEAVRGDTFVTFADWEKSLWQRNASFMISPTTMWGGDSSWKGNYHPGEFGWLREDCSWIEFASSFAKPQTHKKKDGTMFFPGLLKATEGTKGIARGKVNVKQLNFMVFDLEIGSARK